MKYSFYQAQFCSIERTLKLKFAWPPQEILQGLQMPVVALQFCDSATTLAKGKMQFFLRKKREKKSDTRAGVGGKNIT